MPMHDKKSEKEIALVTGASGRLGRHLVEELLKRKIKVRAFLHAGTDTSFLKKAEIFPGDVRDIKTIEPAVEGVDFIYHLAALLGYPANKKELFEINAYGTKNILEAATKKVPSLKRFVYCSSTAVIGKKLAKIPADELTPCHPTDNYGASKLMAEKIVMGYKKKLPVVIIRPAVIYGKGFSDGFFQLFRMLEKGKMRIVGSGNNIIPFVHVKDLVQAMLLASHKEKAIGETYIIAGDENKTQKELLEMSSKELKVEPPNKKIPSLLLKLMLKFSNKAEFGDEHLDLLASNRIFNISKAKNDLGYSPKMKLKDGIKEMVEYFRGVSYE
jgi:nucleoside-diphosphate-sugar epimerase